MKNVRVPLDEVTCRRGRFSAAERGASLTSLVKEFLVSMGAAETGSERLKREEERLRSEIQTFQASDRLGRDGLHARGGF